MVWNSYSTARAAIALALLLSGWSWAARENPARIVLPSAAGSILSVQWSPDGKRLACFTDHSRVYLLGGSTGRRLGSWRVTTGSIVARWSPDWSRLATLGADGRVRVWDVPRRRVVRVFSGRGDAVDVQWSPDGQRLAIAVRGADRTLYTGAGSSRYQLYISRKNLVRIFNVATGKQQFLLRHRVKVGPVQGHTTDRFDVAWSPDGRRIATCFWSTLTWSSPIQLWDAATGRPLRRLGFGDGAPITPAWRPHGTRLAALWEGITIWNPRTGRATRRLEYADEADDLVWSPDGAYVAARNANDYWGYTAGHDARIQVWHVGSGKQVRIFRKKGVFLYGLAWSPDGKHLAWGTSDRTVRIWSLSLRKQSRR